VHEIDVWYVPCARYSGVETPRLHTCCRVGKRPCVDAVRFRQMLCDSDSKETRQPPKKGYVDGVRSAKTRCRCQTVHHICDVVAGNVRSTEGVGASPFAGASGGAAAAHRGASGRTQCRAGTIARYSGYLTCVSELIAFPSRISCSGQNGDRSPLHPSKKAVPGEEAGQAIAESVDYFVEMFN
jgi:hypothetical protein